MWHNFKNDFKKEVVNAGLHLDLDFFQFFKTKTFGLKNSFIGLCKGISLLTFIMLNMIVSRDIKDFH